MFVNKNQDEIKDLEKNIARPAYLMNDGSFFKKKLKFRKL
jgi:hypothetical protein